MSLAPPPRAAPAGPQRHGPVTAGEWERLRDACSGLTPPAALIDLDALEANAATLLRRAAPKPIRIASKSLRCRPLLQRLLASDPRFSGVMAFTLPEALWLQQQGLHDILVAYPTTDGRALRALAKLEVGPGRPVLMVDCVEHLDLIEHAGGRLEAPIEVCIDIDVGWRRAAGRIAVGPKRSPLTAASQALDLARTITSRPALRLVGLMGYEGHVAGVGDRPPGHRLRGVALRRLQPRWMAEAARLRREAVTAISAIADLRIVNAGGTGNLEAAAPEEWVTEVTAGSGFYAPALFDSYSSFRLQPAAMFALPVVRRPAPDVVTVLGGGYIASGAAGTDRLPLPHLPSGLSLDSQEGAGEVQTPLRGRTASRLRIGDPVFFRHAKAGELCERFDRLHLIRGHDIAEVLPTYRGEAQTFL
jgi:D-serine deaminase-like pyridoxal phosphate-dependent protein